MQNIIHISMAIAGGLVSIDVEKINPLIYMLLAFLVIDYGTGFMVAVIQKKLSSKIGFKGIFKKIMILVLVFLSHVLDAYLIKNGSAIEIMVILFYISNEGISILENADKIGVPLPKKLRKIFNQLHEENK